MGVFSRFTSALQHGWNAFNGRDPTVEYKNIGYAGIGYGRRPDRTFAFRGNERTIINSVITRMATDGAAIEIRHARIDQNGRYVDNIYSSLNNCLTTSANLDQTGRALIQDVIETLLQDGTVAVVPTDMSNDPRWSDSFDILELRVGRITEWRPKHVRVKCYNESTGQYEEIYLEKRVVAIIQNPFYTVMNESNSTMQRLTRKISLLDQIDEQSGSGKLDLIIQLPYLLNTDSRKVHAESRRKDIEQQLANSKYGIAYVDGTEHVTQLNRPAENNLQAQIESLTATLLSQLGITMEILNGTAPEDVMLNYYTRTIEPILSAIADEFKRKFLTKTARTQGQSIWFFRDPFKLVPVSKVADIADKFTRNEILSSNEVRGIIGYKPVDDPQANELRNKNLNQATDEVKPPAVVETDEGGNQNGRDV